MKIATDAAWSIIEIVETGEVYKSGKYAFDPIIQSLLTKDQYERYINTDGEYKLSAVRERLFREYISKGDLIKI